MNSRLSYELNHEFWVSLHDVHIGGLEKLEPASLLETYLQQDQHLKSALLSLEPRDRKRDIEATLRDWDKKWKEASRR